MTHLLCMIVETSNVVLVSDDVIYLIYMSSVTLASPNDIYQSSMMQLWGNMFANYQNLALTQKVAHTSLALKMTD